jgi:hypothetical protein
MKRALPIIVIVVAGLLLGQAFYALWKGNGNDARPVTWARSVRWAAPLQPCYQAYFRYTFYIESPPESAWLKLSADNNYALYINGRLVSRESNSVNHAKGLAIGVNSQLKQGINDSRAYRGPVEPMLALWSLPDWKVCVYEDIGKYLTSGRNVIAVVVANSLSKPRLAVDGSIHLTPERSIPIGTGEPGWLVSSQAENRGKLMWYEPQFPDLHWESAIRLGPVQETIYSRLSQTAIERNPWGSWITGTVNDAGEVWLHGRWRIDSLHPRAFVRISSNAATGVMINGRLIDDPTPATQPSGRLYIYEASRLLQEGDNDIAVRLARPDIDATPLLGGAPPQFYMDGWVEDDQGDVFFPFQTDEHWTAFKSPTSGWQYGRGNSEPVLVLGVQRLNQLPRSIRGDAASYDYLRQAPMAFGALALSIASAAGLAYAIRRYWLSSAKLDARSYYAATALLLPGTLALGAISLLTHRYGMSDIALYLTEHRAALISLVTFLLLTMLTLLGQWRGGRCAGEAWANRPRLAALVALSMAALFLAAQEGPILLGFIIALTLGSLIVLMTSERTVGRLSSLLSRLTSYHFVVAAMLGLIVIGAFVMRTQDLKLQALTPDENTSLDVIRGIVQTGIPEATSGIWYTRSPVYHYAVAGWLHLAGDTIIAAQLFSVFWGVALLVVCYLLTAAITGSSGLSLLVTGFLAIDRWLFVVSRIVRFYVVVQFFTILCFYLFYKGFIEKGRPAYRYGFFASLALAILHQELMVTLIPIFGLGMVIFYKPRIWRRDWPLVVGAAAVLAVFAVDVFVFEAKCLTPPVALGSTTDSIAKPHLRFVTAFFSGFFLGSARVYLVLSCFFALGLIHAIVRRDAKRTFLFVAVLVYIAELTMLMRQISVRYTCPIHPLFVILAITSAFDAARALGERFGRSIGSPQALRAALSAIVLATLLLGDEYPRILRGREEQMAKGTTDVTRYIRDHREATDVVMSPAAPSAAIELGGLDYYIASAPLYFDVPYRDGNYIRDRWGGGILLSNPEAFARVFEDSNRVWIYYDDVTESRLSPAMRRQLRTTGRPVMESYAATLRVWDRNRDPFPQVTSSGRDVGPY